MKYLKLLTVISAIALCACQQKDDLKPQEPVLPQITVSELRTTEGGKIYLQVDGKPFPLIGAQIRLDALLNCDGKSLSAVESYFQKAAELGVNCVQVPISWKMVEPQQNEYDWSIVDAVLAYCNEYGLKMELLWFSTNMIGDAFTYLLPQYILSEPSVRLRCDNDGAFHSYYGYIHALRLDADWLLDHETRVVTALFNHIRYWDSEHGENHPVITCQIHNEPDGFLRWRYRDYHFKSWDGSELTPQNVWDMVLNSLDAVGKAVKNSSYKVLTRTNHIKDEDGGDLLQWSDVASVKDVFALDGIDFVGIDAYKQKVSELKADVEAYASMQGNYPLVAENTGSYPNSASLILTAFAAGGGYDIYDLATSEYFVTNATDSSVDQGVYTTGLEDREGITEPARRIIHGLKEAAEDVALSSPENFAAFNIGQDTPQISITEEEKTTTTSSLTVRFSTSAGALGFLLDRGSYIVAYATEDATFVVSKPDGTSETIAVTGGELETRDL